MILKPHKRPGPIITWVTSAAKKERIVTEYGGPEYLDELPDDIPQDVAQGFYSSDTQSLGAASMMSIGSVGSTHSSSARTTRSMTASRESVSSTQSAGRQGRHVSSYVAAGGAPIQSIPSVVDLSEQGLESNPFPQVSVQLVDITTGGQHQGLVQQQEPQMFNPMSPPTSSNIPRPKSKRKESKFRQQINKEKEERQASVLPQHHLGQSIMQGAQSMDEERQRQ